MRHYLTFVLTIFFAVTYGQEFSYPAIKLTGRSITDFVPVGWTILDSAYGDLNKDGKKDAAIVIEHKDSISLENSLEDTVLTHELLEWADAIIVMEKTHRNHIRSKHPDIYKSKRIVCLYIPDEYKFMDPELVVRLRYQ